MVVELMGFDCVLLVSAECIDLERRGFLSSVLMLGAMDRNMRGSSLAMDGMIRDLFAPTAPAVHIMVFADTPNFL